MRSIRKNGKSRKNRIKLKNQNTELPSAARELIRQLPSSILGESFAVKYLQDEFLSKLNDSEPGSAEKRRTAAILKWKATEDHNRIFSKQFEKIDDGFNILPRVTYHVFIKFARRLIADLLGELEDHLVIGNFSGGASTSRTRSTSEKSGKFVGMADITESAMPFIDLIRHVAPLLRQYGCFLHLREVEGAILFTVPKNADIDRCACKEPDINMFLQKGVGRHIRRRLLRVGQNLNDQTINRSLACEGSLTGSLATIDLSSASDTVNTSVVKALLPRNWFLYLNDIRSQHVTVEEETVRTSMFSSMGNGFTFELESLIFWALMKSTSYFRGVRGVVSVYGDDIIVPSEDYDTYLWVLAKFGFLPNVKKSFGQGLFRESCGGHFFAGEDVTPFYLRIPPTRLTDLIRVCNQFRRWIFADPARRYEHPEAYPLWRSLADYVPKMFWGGHDYDLDTRLVSPPLGSWKLVRTSRSKSVDSKGLYLSWHCDNWMRVLDNGMEETISFPPVDTRVFCRRRRANSTFSSVELFYEEQLSPTNPSL
jgi:hypothetical protein